LVALPTAALSARLGQTGVILQRLARGLDLQPLVPIVEASRFEASLDLEWPIEDVQPLSFVLARLLEPLAAALERADRGAAAIVTELTLVRLPASVTAPSAAETSVDAQKSDTARACVRRLELPAPMRDPRVLRTLILLDLESHPPAAGIDRIAIRIEPTPARIVQYSLLERAGPQPETIATLVSRLTALMGEGRVGSPVLLDSHAPDAFALVPFRSTLRQNQSPAPRSAQREGGAEPTGGTCLRRFRLPVAARVVMMGGRLVRVTTDRVGLKGGDVRQCAGPWRSSGHWWARACRASESPTPVESAWDRDEYDVALDDGAAYRVYRDRHEDRWFVEGILD
jgi:protein ImuB